MDCGAGGCEASSSNTRSTRMVVNCGNCTRNSFAARRLRRCFSRRRLRAPSGPTDFDFMIGASSTASVAAAATAARLVLRFIHLQRAAAEVLAVQRLHRALRVRARHFHEAEAARPTGFAIVDERDFFHGAVCGEQFAHAVFRGAEGQISNVEFGQENILETNVKAAASDGARAGAAQAGIRRVRKGTSNEPLEPENLHSRGKSANRGCGCGLSPVPGPS